MVRPGQIAEPKPLPIDRAKQLTKPFAGDDALDTWAAKLLADSEAFQSNKRSDPLGNLFVMNSR
ncbi:MAG: hypothetical protein JWP25_8247 [Bradyrhizobium sp.]|nr:hypothetical protein [Bradyrhizobium sp.]